jgi:hypothetical protein
MAFNKIWDTDLINDTLQRFRYGENVELDCFHQRDPELKGAEVLFQLTHEEEAEFNKCAQDVQYFVETYCRFLTDYGRVTVELRDFQSDILATLGEEVFIEKLDDFGPKVRNYILMASRQTGKCFSFDTQIVIKNTSTNSLIKISVGQLYSIINKRPNKSKKEKFITKIKNILYNIYNTLS